MVSKARDDMAVMFVLGFSTVFVALGASASLIGGLIRPGRRALDRRRDRHHRHGSALPRADEDRLADAEGRLPIPKPVGLWEPMSWAWRLRSAGRPASADPGGILSVAAAERRGKGAGLPRDLSAGLGIPFLVAGLHGRTVLVAVFAMKRHLASVERAMGVLMIITASAFYRQRVHHQHLVAGDVSRLAEFRLETGFRPHAELASLLKYCCR